ncbi:hypothetical protein V6N13_035684 [Hibiscus sabdariffa]|uniref:Uncharacterized protein n=1 Tax=Hibiscus sabdariffa TaxID=183260 RepID=A0ABR2S9B8_9ROSI
MKEFRRQHSSTYCHFKNELNSRDGTQLKQLKTRKDHDSNCEKREITGAKTKEVLKAGSFIVGKPRTTADLNVFEGVIISLSLYLLLLVIVVTRILGGKGR